MPNTTHRLAREDVLYGLDVLADAYERFNAERAEFKVDAAQAAALIKAARAFMDDVPKWHSAAEKKPEPGVPVLAHCGGGRSYECQISVFTWQWVQIDTERSIHPPIVWTAMPSPPGATQCTA
ncbi:MAG: hypothetical protein EBR82_47690 [Caulobacteraceae bacterium]|nr:hypothetical protein [Caulobacteraceae bacterium]